MIKPGTLKTLFLGLFFSFIVERLWADGIVWP